MEVNVKFLKSIAGKCYSSGNINKISKDVYVFTIYNFLPGTNPHGLDGHYTFAVNITNFNYVYWKDSDYGSFTWVRDNTDKIFLPVHESIKEQIDGLIATKLLGAYWYYADSINHQGKNLFEDEDYYPHKTSLICTWVDDYPNEPLGQIKDIEKEAIKVLQL